MHIQSCHIQNPSLFRIHGILKSLLNSLFEHFRDYVAKIRGIDAYSATLTDAQLERRGETSPSLFEIKKSVLILETEALILSLKSVIQNVVLRVSRTKISETFLCWPSSCVFHKMFIKVPFSPTLKNCWLSTCTQALFSLQNNPS